MWYYSVTKTGRDPDGYEIPVGKYHLAIAKNHWKTLCGLKIDAWYFSHADNELRQWLIDRTTCETCKKIANKRIISSLTNS